MSTYTILVACFFLGLWILFTYLKFSNLIKKTNKIWADCQPLLKNRYQVLPILINITKNQADFDPLKLATLQYIYSQASDPRTLPQIQFENDRQATTLIFEVLVFLQNYSNAKLNPEFVKLESYLIGVENQLNLFKSSYNATVEEYNVALNTTPTSFMAKLMQLRSKEFLPIANYS